MGRFIWLSAIFGWAVFWGLAGWAYVDGSRQRTWAKVEAKIVESTVRRYTASCRARSDSSTCTYYEPAVRYAYEYGGQRFESSELGGLRSASTDPRDAREEAAKFPPGAAVPAYVNPAEPSRSVLRTTFPSWFFALLAGAGVFWAAVWLGVGRLVTRDQAKMG
jgi:hypothetical protein